jgi:cytochrome c553
MRLRLLLIAAVAAVIAAPGAAWADGATISAGARLAATCAACHGTDGATKDLATLPRLAGQSQQALSASLHAFKAGTRPATIMTQIAKGYTDEQIELLAAYFAAQKK